MENNYEVTENVVGNETFENDNFDTSIETYEPEEAVEKDSCYSVGAVVGAGAIGFAVGAIAKWAVDKFIEKRYKTEETETVKSATDNKESKGFMKIFKRKNKVKVEEKPKEEVKQ